MPYVLPLALRFQGDREVTVCFGQRTALPQNLESPHRVREDVPRIDLNGAAILARGVEASHSFAQAQEVTPAHVSQQVRGALARSCRRAAREDRRDLVGNVFETSAKLAAVSVVEPFHG